MILAREKRAAQGRRERQYWGQIGATEDPAMRRFAAASAQAMSGTELW